MAEHRQLVGFLAEQVLEDGGLNKLDHGQYAILAFCRVLPDGDDVVQPEAHIAPNFLEVILHVLLVLLPQEADKLRKEKIECGKSDISLLKLLHYYYAVSQPTEDLRVGLVQQVSDS